MGSESLQAMMLEAVLVFGTQQNLDVRGMHHQCLDGSSASFVGWSLSPTVRRSNCRPAATLTHPHPHPPPFFSTHPHHVRAVVFRPPAGAWEEWEADGHSEVRGATTSADTAGALAGSKTRSGRADQYESTLQRLCVAVDDATKKPVLGSSLFHHDPFPP